METKRLQSRLDIVVVGAGLAGITAAVRLADAGHRVRLFERSKFLGGRAGSVYNAEAGCDLDIGQHVYLYCCTRYRALLERLDTLQLAPIQQPFSIPVIDARTYPNPGSVSTLKASRLPRPVHLAPAFLMYRHLSLSERLSTAKTLLAMAKLSREDAVHKGTTFGAWLRAQGESERAIESFWNVVVVAALNASVENVSTAAALMLFQEALLKDRRGPEVGVARVPLAQLVEPVHKILSRRDGEIHTGARITQVRVEGGVATGVTLADGSVVDADGVILAVGHRQVRRLLPTEWAEHTYFADIDELPTGVIYDVHMGFQVPVTPPDFRFGVFLHSPVQWLFAHEQGRRLAISISDPRDLVGRPAKDVKRLIVNEVRRLFGCGEPDWVVVRRHANATFSVAPGAERFRKAQRTPISGLYLAGDWTHTGWPATMESAVRSGEMAAVALMAHGSRLTGA